MKWVYLFLTVLFLSGENLPAQGAHLNKDTTRVLGWFPKAVIGFNISQIELKNWSQGGDNSVTWIGTFNGSLDCYASDGWDFKNSLILEYGRSKSGDQDFRTNANELYLTDVLSKHIGWAVDPFFSNDLLSALTTGYSYSQNTPVAVAGFFDPAYATQSLGFTYNKESMYNTRLGIAAQETFDNRFRQYTNDTSITRSRRFKFDTGVESVSNVKFPVAENIALQSSLRLFTRFESLDVWDVRWETIITGKINSFLNMNFSYLLIYQKDQSLDTQMKEGLNVGFVYSFL
jgi:hypothetical protein